MPLHPYRPAARHARLHVYVLADVSEISKTLSTQAEQFKWSSKKLSLMVSERARLTLKVAGGELFEAPARVVVVGGVCLVVVEERTRF